MRCRPNVGPLVASALLGLLAAAPAPTAPTGDDDLPVVTGGVSTYRTVAGDSWNGLRARFGVDARTLADDNGLTAAQPLPVGVTLAIDNRHIVPPDLARIGLVVNVPQRMLFHHSGGVVMAAPLAIGQPAWRTPLGPFTIVSREVDPTWDVPASILAEAHRAGKQLPAKVPPGPANPLGKYWLGLSVGGVGIHGTNAPASIYGAVTHGCMRLAAADIATLFARVQVGMSGALVYEPVLMAIDGDEILLEVHPDFYRRVPDAAAVARALAASLGVDARIDWTVAARVISARQGIARAVQRR